MHKRNAHKGKYPLDKLCAIHPDLSKFVVSNQDGDNTIDFADPDGIKALNKALLHYYYKLPLWDIPPDYLCPPVPGRADYIHHIADLLSDSDESQIPKGKQIKGLDIGTGANLIYPIIAHAEYGWQMLGSDIDKGAIASAKTILKANPRFAKHIKVSFQANTNNIFAGIVNQNDSFDFCMCNPPFHASENDALQSTNRKSHNLARNKQRRQSPVKPSASAKLNFAGQANELWCEGGELAFISRMINESSDYANQIKWFTSLISKSENVPLLVKHLKKIGVTSYKKIEMSQGNKVSRFIAWRL